MAKGNQKANKKPAAKEIVGDIQKGFKDYDEVFDLLIDQSTDMNMPLLVQSIQLSKSILNTYKKAWIFRVREDQAKAKVKNQA